MDRRFVACAVLFLIVTSLVAVSAAAQSDVLTACNELAPDEIKKLEETRKLRGGAGFTALFFALDGQLCNINRQFGVVGDPIHVFLLVGENYQNLAQAQFAPCALEPAGISIYASGAFPTLTPELKALVKEKKYIFLHLLPRTCFNTSVDITIKEKPDGPDLARYTLTQYERYRATLQVGAFFTNLHDNTYGLRPEAGGTQMRIFDKGPTKTGPEYYASVVVYGLPHYFAELGGKNRTHYLGRDIVNDQGWRDRLGGVIAASATDPSKRFAIGLSFEAVRGINLVGALEFAKVKRLVGFNEGDVFTGAENTIPVRDQWNRQFVGGLSLDFRYITALFSRR